MRRLLLVFLTVAALPMGAQSPSPSAISSCVRAVADSYAVRTKVLRDAAAASGQPAVTTAAVNQRMADLKSCASRFSVGTTRGADLADLASLYASAGMPDEAWQAWTARMADASLTEGERATVMASAVSAAMGDYSPANMARAEQLVARIDQLSNAVIPQKIAAHSTLRGRYRYEDVNDRIVQHSRAIIALGRQVKAAPPPPPAALASASQPAVPYRQPPGTVAAGVLLSGYANMAEVYGDLGHADSALQMLDQALKDHPEIDPKDAALYLDNERDRYRLVGQPAEILTAGHWINMPAGATSIAPKGKVTFIEFSAHWCVPCQHSYPTVTAMAKEFIPQGAQFVLMTEFYGYLGQKRPLDEAAEFEADKEYFIHEHEITFPIGIDPQYVYKAGATKPPNNGTRYQVGGIPQTVIIDRKGIIRRILTGWDQGNAQRLPPLIKALLAEKAS